MKVLFVGGSRDGKRVEMERTPDVLTVACSDPAPVRAMRSIADDLRAFAGVKREDYFLTWLRQPDTSAPVYVFSGLRHWNGTKALLDGYRCQPRTGPVWDALMACIDDLVSGRDEALVAERMAERATTAYYAAKDAAEAREAQKRRRMSDGKEPAVVP